MESKIGIKTLKNGGTLSRAETLLGVCGRMNDCDSCKDLRQCIKLWDKRVDKASNGSWKKR